MKVKLNFICHMLSGHTPKSGSINASVKNISDPVNQFMAEASERVSGVTLQVIESSHGHTVVMSLCLCLCPAGAVGRGTSREKSDSQTVLCGPGLWERPPGSHTEQ